MQTGLMSLTMLKEPAEEIVTLEQVINFVHSTGDEEEFMSMLLSASRDIFEAKMGMAFQTEQFQAVFEMPTYRPDLADILPADWTTADRVCTLPRAPLQHVDLVELETEFDVWSVVDTTAYGVRTMIPAEVIIYSVAYQDVVVGYFTQYRAPRIRVTYTTGYLTQAQVPDRYRLMLLQIIAHNYIQREGISIPTDIMTSIQGEKVMVL